MHVKAMRLIRLAEKTKKDFQNTAKALVQKYEQERYVDISRDSDVCYEVHDLDSNLKIYAFNDSHIVILEYDTPITTNTSPDNIVQASDATYLEALERLGLEQYNQGKMWTAHWLILKPDELTANAELLRSWLKDTICPEDAEALLNRKQSASMTWLHYALVTDEEQEENLDAMRIAQYYYAEFDQINKDLLELMQQLASAEKSRSLEQLNQSRLDIEVRDMLFRIQLDEHFKTLPRRKKRKIEEILAHWEFEVLRHSTQQVDSVCNNIINSRRLRKSALSNYATEIILVAIGLVAIIDLAISWALSSRHFQTDPTLLVNETALPFTARLFSETPMDTIIASTLAICFLIAALYSFFKSRSK